MKSALERPHWIDTNSVRFRWFSDLMLLTKARANIAVVCTAFVGFALHREILANWLLLVHTLIGTGLLAGSAAIANQVIEHRFDSNMERTRHRPIPAGRLGRRQAFLLCAVSAFTGALWLLATVNLLATLFAILAFLIYVFAYTPLKRRSPACILVGAVSGALPISVGWAATGAEFGFWAIVPFALLFLWQIPHFRAIAWWRRADYLSAGYRVLNREDVDGSQTAVWSLLSTFVVFGVSLLPVMVRQVSGWYWFGAIVLGSLFSAAAIRFLRRRDEARARSLFFASLYYLPAVFALMLLCRIKG